MKSTEIAHIGEAGTSKSLVFLLDEWLKQSPFKIVKRLIWWTKQAIIEVIVY